MSNPGVYIGLVAVLGIFTIPIVAIIGHFTQESIRAWAQAGLKRDMVARGYTAQEIIQVIVADQEKRPPAWLPNVPPAKPIKQPVCSA